MVYLKTGRDYVSVPSIHGIEFFYDLKNEK